MKNKFLIAINDLKDIEDFKSLGINNFAFPIKDFTVGYENLFSLSEIKDYLDSSYLIINRLLDAADIEDLKILLKDYQNIKGVILSDLGVFKIIQNINPKIELIWNIEHFGTNYHSLNYWLEKGFDSAFIANEITLKQIDEILSNVKKPLIVQIFGYPIISYSRRLLLSNYFEFYDLEKSNKKIMLDRVSKNEFIFLENKYGTTVFNKLPYDGREILNLKQDDKIKYYFINYNFLSKEEIIKVIKNIDEIKTHQGFLHQETIYKIRRKEND